MDASLVPRGFVLRRRADGREELVRDPAARSAHRIRCILSSIHRDVQAGSRVRARRVLENPVEVWRLELAREDLAYERTTLLDGDTFEMLLEETPPETLREAYDFA